MSERIREILTDLETVRENLLALSDDIWLGIDHNNQAALEAGVQFKRAYNEKIAQFDVLASELSELIQGYTKVTVEPESADHVKTDAETDRIMKELNKEEPHTLQEDFSYKRPYGFVLRRWALKDVVTWKRLYLELAVLLKDTDQKRFATLPNNPKFVTSQNNPFFSTNPDELRSANLVADGIYAETNLSANRIKECMRRLLIEFGIDPSEMRIYLRQDRNATPQG